MIQQSTFNFLKALKKNNDRIWFDRNKDKYLDAKADFESFVSDLLKGLVKVNPAYNNLAVKDCVFRIYRDVRFSKNKDPYKTNMGAYFVEGGKKSSKAGFYVQVAPGNCFIGGGCWMPGGPELKAIRQEIDYNLVPFKKILNTTSFKKTFGELEDYKLKTTPKGYEKENPAIEYLRNTSFVVSVALNEKDFTSKGAVKKCVDTYKTMYPFLKFLNTSFD